MVLTQITTMVKQTGFLKLYYKLINNFNKPLIAQVTEFRLKEQS